MYCSNCGAKIEDSIRHCPNCGAVIVPNAVKTSSASGNPSPLPDPGNVLFWGILGFALSFVFGPLGIVFGCIGLSKANQYFTLPSAEFSKKVSLARSFSIAALFIGLAATVLLALWIYLLVNIFRSAPSYI